MHLRPTPVTLGFLSLMDFLTTTLQVILLITIVLILFNIIIFVHELGHFWAAKWRGLQIDRFQIWFGKPIWKKTINGVQYGLGWIPAGGFVALPQMAPMEAIEGGEKHEEPLPKISAMDKIIVAFAGPLFSILLGLVAATAIWQIGKPKDFIPSQEIGYILPDSPAQKAGLQVGDTILKINGETVEGFAGSLDSITESIILSRGDKLVFTVQRPGHDQPLTITSSFERPDTHWWQRSGLRQIGIDNSSPVLVAKVMPNSPAADAGLKPGDRIVSVDGQPIFSPLQFSTYLRDQEWKTVRVNITGADGSARETELTPERPLQPKDSDPMVGIYWDLNAGVDTRIVHPDPFSQVGDSLRMMWVTLTSLIAKDSSVGIDHLSGPVGIGNMMFQFLKTEDGWRRILAFMVLFNVNLAVLNMLPFPVLDGGHITLAVMEKIAGRPVKAKVLEVLQAGCAILLISLMLFVTSKDISDFGGGGGGSSKEVIFPE